MTREEICNSMTLQDAIQVFRDTNAYGTMDIAKTVILKALEQQQPNEDCISRKAVLEEINKYIEKAQSTGTKDDFISFQELVIKQLPPVIPQPKTEPQQKTGHWTHDGGYWKNRWICSECGYKLYDEQSRFCPDCGSYNGGKK